MILFLMSVCCFIAALVLTLKLKTDVRKMDDNKYAGTGSLDCGAFRADCDGYALYVLETKK